MGTHFSLKVLLEVPLATVIPGCLFRPRASSGHLFSVATARAFWSRASQGPGGPGTLRWTLQPADPMVAPNGWWRPAPCAAAQSRPALYDPLDCSTPGSPWVAAVSAFHSRPFPGSAAGQDLLSRLLAGSNCGGGCSGRGGCSRATRSGHLSGESRLSCLLGPSPGRGPVPRVLHPGGRARDQVLQPGADRAPRSVSGAGPWASLDRGRGCASGRCICS